MLLLSSTSPFLFYSNKRKVVQGSLWSTLLCKKHDHLLQTNDKTCHPAWYTISSCTRVVCVSEKNKKYKSNKKEHLPLNLPLVSRVGEKDCFACRCCLRPHRLRSELTFPLTFNHCCVYRLGTLRLHGSFSYVVRVPNRVTPFGAKSAPNPRHLAGNWRGELPHPLCIFSIHRRAVL